MRFTKTQKDEFDELRNENPEMTLYDALKEVRTKESTYPVLFLYLFGSDDNCTNQKQFAVAWADPDSVTIEVKKYYLLIYAGMYISLDPDDQVCFTQKWDYSLMYKKKFTQDEIDDLQHRDEFANRVELDNCKVEVTADDKANPMPTPEPPEEPADDEPKADEAIADESVLKE